MKTNGMHVYHVRSSDNHQWMIEEENGGPVLETYDDRNVAVDHAVEYAQSHQPSQIVVHEEDDTVVSEQTYGVNPFPEPPAQW